ncbi:MAG: mechanosensitive ion channel family protein [Bacteroidales bacterium]|nr:mechanosensitive ion channel family protein [Bacteroidales bacterium]
MKDIIIWNNSLLDILISFAVIVGGFFAAKLIYLIFTKIFGKLAAKTESTLDDLLVEKFKAPFMFAAIIAAIWFAIRRLNIPETAETAIGKIYTVLITINFTWAFSQLFSGVLQNILDRVTLRDDAKLNKGMSFILQRAVTYVVWAMGILVAMHNVGIHIGTLLAGLGIGGVAVALAAQDTIKNLLGGIMLFFDRPFNLGERIRFAGIDGYVMNIGLRSLRVQTLDGRIVTIPNSQVVDNAIENVTSEPSTRIKLTLGLTYQTTPEKMDLAMKLLCDLPKTVPSIEEKTSANFMEYGDFSLKILFIYYIRKSEDYYKTQSDVNREILRLFSEYGLEFAFPTQTIYTKSEA